MLLGETFHPLLKKASPSRLKFRSGFTLGLFKEFLSFFKAFLGGIPILFEKGNCRGNIGNYRGSPHSLSSLSLSSPIIFLNKKDRNPLKSL